MPPPIGAAVTRVIAAQLILASLTPPLEWSADPVEQFRLNRLAKTEQMSGKRYPPSCSEFSASTWANFTVKREGEPLSRYVPAFVEFDARTEVFYLTLVRWEDRDLVAALRTQPRLTIQGQSFGLLPRSDRLNSTRACGN